MHVTYCTKQTLDMHDHINKEPLKYPYITHTSRHISQLGTSSHETHFHLHSCHLHTQTLDKLNRLAQISRLYKRINPHLSFLNEILNCMLRFPLMIIYTQKMDAKVYNNNGQYLYWGRRVLNKIYCTQMLIYHLFNICPKMIWINRTAFALWTFTLEKVSLVLTLKYHQCSLFGMSSYQMLLSKTMHIFHHESLSRGCALMNVVTMFVQC